MQEIKKLPSVSLIQEEEKFEGILPNANYSTYGSKEESYEK